MRLLASAVRWELIILFTSFVVVTLWRLLTTGSLAGLLRSSDKTFSAGRLQLLMLTVLTALQYLISTISDPSHLPTLPTNLVTALGGSQLVYLGAKAREMDLFGPKRRNREEQ